MSNVQELLLELRNLTYSDGISESKVGGAGKAVAAALSKIQQAERKGAKIIADRVKSLLAKRDSVDLKAVEISNIEFNDGVIDLTLTIKLGPLQTAKEMYHIVHAATGFVMMRQADKTGKGVYSVHLQHGS